MRLSVRERYDEEKSLDGTPWAPLAAATLARKKMDYLRRRIAAAPELWRDVQIWTRKNAARELIPGGAAPVLNTGPFLRPLCPFGR